MKELLKKRFFGYAKVTHDHKLKEAKEREHNFELLKINAEILKK
jgi:hypothetical protein